MPRVRKRHGTSTNQMILSADSFFGCIRILFLLLSAIIDLFLCVCVCFFLSFFLLLLLLLLRRQFFPVSVPVAPPIRRIRQRISTPQGPAGILGNGGGGGPVGGEGAPIWENRQMFLVVES